MEAQSSAASSGARVGEYYGWHLLAGRSAMASAAHAQGRTLKAMPAPQAGIADVPLARLTIGHRSVSLQRLRHF
jgi:hypothetical protein